MGFSMARWGGRVRVMRVSTGWSGCALRLGREDLGRRLAAPNDVALLGDELEPKAAPPRDRRGRSSDRGRRAGERGARRVDQLVDVLALRGGELAGVPTARDLEGRSGVDRVCVTDTNPPRRCL